MSEKGWISVHREINDNWIWQNQEPFDKRSAWIDLLLMVNYQDNKIMFDGNLVKIYRGQRLTSIRKLSEKWKWSNTKVKNFLNVLEKDGMILLEIAPQKATLLTIVNYDKYQSVSDSKNVTETSVKHQQSISETSQEHINNKDNKDNNVNNDDGVLDLQNFVTRFNKLTGLKIKSSSIQNLFLEIYESKGKEIFEDALNAITESDYLKKCYDAVWFLENIDKVVAGRYRNNKVEKEKSPAQNFQGQWSGMSAEDLDRIAREQTKRRNEQI